VRHWVRRFVDKRVDLGWLGAIIPEEYGVEYVVDRVATTSSVFLGLTLGCSRCHDHKFDPFTLRDYYGLYDIFNQMSETGAGRGGQAPPVIDMSTPGDDQGDCEWPGSTFRSTTSRLTRP